MIFLIIIGVPISLYVASLKLNPWMKCSKCHNSPKIKGWVTRAHHVCPVCKGTGQELRFGGRFIFGQPNPPHNR